MTLCIIATAPLRSVSVLPMMLALTLMLALSLAWFPPSLDSFSFLSLETPWSRSPWNGSPMLMEKRGRGTEGFWAPHGALNSVEDLWVTFDFTLFYKLGFLQSTAAGPLHLLLSDVEHFADFVDFVNVEAFADFVAFHYRWTLWSALYNYTRSLGAPWLLDFVLRALRSLRPCDPCRCVHHTGVHDAYIHDVMHVYLMHVYMMHVSMRHYVPMILDPWFWRMSVCCMYLWCLCLWWRTSEQ